LGTPPELPFKSCGPIFCQVMGPIGLCHAEKFQHSLTPKGGDMRGQEFFFPPQNSLVRPPHNYVIMSAFMSPTNPENLVKVVVQIFLSAHLKIWDSCICHTCTNPRERSQLLILLHNRGGRYWWCNCRHYLEVMTRLFSYRPVYQG